MSNYAPQSTRDPRLSASSTPALRPSNGLSTYAPPSALAMSRDPRSSSSSPPPPHPNNGRVSPLLKPTLNPNLTPTSKLPTCPTILVRDLKTKAMHPCRIKSMHYTVDCHISTAFCSAEFSCVVQNLPPKTKGAALFHLPTSPLATVTELYVLNTTTRTVFVTAVVPATMAKSLGGKARQATNTRDEEDVVRGDPEMFRVQLPLVETGHVLQVRVQWFVPLSFADGYYMVRLPTSSSSSMMQDVSIKCTINTGVQAPVPWGNCNVQMRVVSQELGRVELESNSISLNEDFTIGYGVWNDSIVASCNIQLAAPTNPDPRGSFVLTLAPPNPRSVASAPRAVVFVLDTSGSMFGEPLDFAKRALQVGLRLLSSNDVFTIIAYNHVFTSFSPTLTPGSGGNVDKAIEWMSNLQAGGMTDILTPLKSAVELVMAAASLLPYIFLITDGKVENEREICEWSMGLGGGNGGGRVLPRINTFGIGPYCNAYFLKQLAFTARGLNDTALKPTHIHAQMTRLLVACEKPVLVDVALQIQGLSSIELYPFPIPDLFSGCPLVLSGKYTGKWPSSFNMIGKLARSRQPYSQAVMTTSVAQVPLDKVFARQRLDLLTAKAWLTEDKKLEQQVVEFSVRENIPCVYTNMIGVEISESKYQDFVRERNQHKLTAGKIAGAALGGAAAVGVVGVSVLAFGSLIASMNNIPLGDAFDVMGSGIADLMGDMADGCDCGECCGNCADCCGDCFEAIGGCLGN